MQHRKVMDAIMHLRCVMQEHSAVDEPLLKIGVNYDFYDQFLISYMENEIQGVRPSALGICEVYGIEIKPTTKNEF